MANYSADSHSIDRLSNLPDELLVTILSNQIPEFTGNARGRKKKDWGSRLPRNADRNFRYAYFEDPHLEENRKEIIKLLSKKCSSKRRARK